MEEGKKLHQLAILAVAITLLASVFITVTAIEEHLAASSTSPSDLLSQQESSSSSTIHGNYNVDPFSATHFFAPVLTHLGFHELAMAVPSISHSSTSALWSGSFTVFAPSDDTIRTCASCIVPRLLQEHIIPGVFSYQYLKSLSFGTKIETIVPGRCVTVTATYNSSTIFVGGVEITRPDLFNNGMFVVHGIEGYVAHLSPVSCNVERMTSLSFSTPQLSHSHAYAQHSIMRLMLSDSMLRLRITGYSILALAFKVKYTELVNLQNMTVFALDDVSIFTGGQTYVSNIRFHIVPNKLLTLADLENLPVATVLPTLEEGQHLVISTAGNGITPMRINYARIKIPNLMHNLKIIIHGLYLPFPHIPSNVMGFGGIVQSGLNVVGGDTAGSTAFSEIALSPAYKSRSEFDNDAHHGL